MHHRLAQRNPSDDVWERNWWPSAYPQIEPDRPESSTITMGSSNDGEIESPSAQSGFARSTMDHSHLTGPTPTFFPFTRPIPPWVSSQIQTAPADLQTSSVLATTKPPFASEHLPWQTTTEESSEPTGEPYFESHKNPQHAIKFAAGIGIPLLVLSILGLLLYFYLRRRKQQRANSPQPAGGEMKMRKDGTYPQTAFVAQPHYSAPTVPSPSAPIPAPPSAPVAPQPVILGPIPSGSNGAYYTGIDTSDVASDAAGAVNPFADQAERLDDPPPPYRPRSLAPISRDTSLRQPPSFAHSQTNLIPSAGELERSPFADPPDDDAISDISEPSEERFDQRDAMSAVSDMSYQEESVATQSNI